MRHTAGRHREGRNIPLISTLIHNYIHTYRTAQSEKTRRLMHGDTSSYRSVYMCPLASLTRGSYHSISVIRAPSRIVTVTRGEVGFACLVGLILSHPEVDAIQNRKPQLQSRSGLTKYQSTSSRIIMGWIITTGSHKREEACRRQMFAWGERREICSSFFIISRIHYILLTVTWLFWLQYIFQCIFYFLNCFSGSSFNTYSSYHYYHHSG